MRSVYGRQTPPPDYELTCVEPGSPMGELLCRYWQPVYSSDELRDLPKKVKLLFEELVIFREKKGRVGVLEPHCSHRLDRPAGTLLQGIQIDAADQQWCHRAIRHCLSRCERPVADGQLMAECRHSPISDKPPTFCACRASIRCCYSSSAARCSPSPPRFRASRLYSRPTSAGSSVPPSHTTDIMRPSAVKVRRPRALPT
jgi:Rieske [2Fe-2S] domain